MSAPRSLPGGRRAVGALLVGAMAAVGGILWGARSQDAFPHAAHEGLFPTCVGCHAGATVPDSALVTVRAEDCAACHDGEELPEVAWREPEPTPTNLAFDHGTHSAALAAKGAERVRCAGCHLEADAASRMDVTIAVAESCIACHAADAPGHLAYEVRCATCHLPLAEADRLPVARVAELPVMPDHDAPGFVLDHGERARAETGTCAVCHARESCERCHLNAADLPAVADLAPDARVASVVADRPGEWPEPPSHAAADWTWAHGGAAAAAPEACASCHARPSCAACHTTGLPLLARMPVPRAGGPRGVLLADARPPGHTVDFVFAHGTAAAVGAPDCTACHAERQCAECHDASRRPRFHPVDFVVRHGPEAFGAESECAACHSTEAFCRDCHDASGIAAGGRTGGAFHDASPDWLLGHGGPARQALESCAGCHAQSTCLRCHSAKSGFRINPHGPGFDADRIADRSRESCAICHFEIPEGS